MNEEKLLEELRSILDQYDRRIEKVEQMVGQDMAGHILLDIIYQRILRFLQKYPMDKMPSGYAEGMMRYRGQVERNMDTVYRSVFILRTPLYTKENRNLLSWTWQELDPLYPFVGGWQNEEIKGIKVELERLMAMMDDNLRRAES